MTYLYKYSLLLQKTDRVTTQLPCFEKSRPSIFINSSPVFGNESYDISGLNCFKSWSSIVRWDCFCPLNAAKCCKILLKDSDFTTISLYEVVPTPAFASCGSRSRLGVNCSPCPSSIIGIRFVNWLFVGMLITTFDIIAISLTKTTQFIQRYFYNFISVSCSCIRLCVNWLIVSSRNT